MKDTITLDKRSEMKQTRLYMGGFALLAFVCIFVFFTQVHPMYAFDLDDWLYLYYGRHALPDMMEWNPTKILPETLFPLVSYIGAYLIYPLNRDYMQSLCYAFAGTTSLFITGYILAAAWVVRKRFQIEGGILAVLSGIFLLGHFLPFMVQDFDNAHLFHANDVTCIFNYIIPALLNAILCCYFLGTKQKDWRSKDHLLQKSFLVLAVYLAIHSNLLGNIILMALFGIQLLFALVDGVYENWKCKQKWISGPFLREYIWQHLPKIAAILSWLTSMIFEISGERSLSTPSGMNLYGSVFWFVDSILKMNPVFLIGVILINMAAFGVGIYRFRKYRERKFLYWQLEMIFCMGLSVLYLVLVCAKVRPEYIVRSDVMISWMVFLMLMTLFALAYLARNLPATILLLPLLLYILFFETVTDYSTYADPFLLDQGGAAAKAICDDIIQQVCEADAAGLEEVEVSVPASLADGWPLDTTLSADRIPKALFHHNLKEKIMDVTIVADPNKDIQFHLD